MPSVEGHKDAHDPAARYADAGWLEARFVAEGMEALVQVLLEDLRSTAGGGPGWDAGLERLLLLFQAEAPFVDGWRPAEDPAFFAQQIHNRAASLGRAAMAASAAEI